MDNILLLKKREKLVMDEDRIKHCLSVARKMVEIGKEKNMTNKQLEELFVLGLNHDIGYEFAESNKHNIVGAEILKKQGYPYWKEIYYHGETETEYNSNYLTILNQADMQIDKYGNDVGYDKRLEDIKNRYGEESIIFKKCKKLINFYR